MPRLRSYWNAKANALMTPNQRKATDERYAKWMQDKHTASEIAKNAASVERARKWAQEHPEEAKERNRKAREARKARRLADPAYQQHHKELRRKHKANYRASPSGLRVIRASSLKPKGWTTERYDSALQEQDNRCAICREPFPRTPCADHAHTEPPVPRGLLCNSCNSCIGFAKDSPELLETAAAYLRKFSPVS
jgi:hypothetical protein